MIRAKAKGSRKKEGRAQRKEVRRGMGVEANQQVHLLM